MIRILVDVKDTQDGSTMLGIEPIKKGNVTRMEFDISSLAIYLVHEINELLSSPRGTNTVTIDENKLLQLARDLSRKLHIHPADMEDSSMPEGTDIKDILC